MSHFRSKFTFFLFSSMISKQDGEHTNIHKHSFNNIDANQTTLSSYIRELKRKKVNFDLKWDIIDHAKPFNPVSGMCALCTREKYYIAFKPAWATLNKRSEMYSSCRHTIRMLLCEERLRLRPRHPIMC